MLLGRTKLSRTHGAGAAAPGGLRLYVRVCPGAAATSAAGQLLIRLTLRQGKQAWLPRSCRTCCGAFSEGVSPKPDVMLACMRRLVCTFSVAKSCPGSCCPMLVYPGSMILVLPSVVVVDLVVVLHLIPWLAKCSCCCSNRWPSGCFSAWLQTDPECVARVTCSIHA